LPAKLQQVLVKSLVAMELPVKGKTTFKEEFVTCGGVQLAEINPATMESRLAPGLYFAGEVMDVDGITGGFNFQHAWSSGYIAAAAVAAAVN
jgi:predicted flavoprotein YhiN